MQRKGDDAGDACRGALNECEIREVKIEMPDRRPTARKKVSISRGKKMKHRVSIFFLHNNFFHKSTDEIRFWRGITGNGS